MAEERASTQYRPPDTKGDDEHGLRLILYASQRTAAAETIDLDALVRHAGASNRKQGITGCLIATHERFAQCIEGPEHLVEPLMDRIATDVRHTSIVLLRDEAVTDRRFAGWCMGYAGQADYAAHMIADAINGAVTMTDRQPSERLILLMAEFVR